jgi:hypothetical protein
MNTPSLVDPRMLASLKAAGYLPTQVTIQANTPTVSEYGGTVPAWANVTGLVNLDAAVARSRLPRSSDLFQPQLTEVVSTHEITIAGAFNNIKPNMRALAGTHTYTILIVWVDSQQQTTVLAVREVTT